jgi:integrase
MARAVSNPGVQTRTKRLRQPLQKRIPTNIGDKLTLIYRRPLRGNGTWQAQFWHQGAHLKHRLAEADDYCDANGTTVLTYYQAQEAAKGWASEILRPSRPTDKPVTVKEAAEHYMAWFREHRKSARETERTIEAHVLPAFGNRLVMELTAFELKRWHEKLAASPPRRRTRRGSQQKFGEKAMTADAKRARKSTANRILAVFKALLNKAFEDGLAPDDREWRRVKPFKQVDEPVVRFLTVAESTRLINTCRADFRRLVQAALLTGCRYGELTRILVSHVNLDTGLLYITAEAKSGRSRHVPLNDEGLRFFREQMIGKSGLDYVFKKEDGNPWLKNHQSRLMKAACNQAQIEPAIGFHELRHTYASLLAQAGADLLTISKLLGHADTRVTSRHYAHLCDKTLANTVRTLLPGFGYKKDSNVALIR